MIDGSVAVTATYVRTAILKRSVQAPQTTMAAKGNGQILTEQAALRNARDELHVRNMPERLRQIIVRTTIIQTIHALLRTQVLRRLFIL